MKVLFAVFFAVLTFTGSAKCTKDPKYTVPDSPWPESFGNHRAVLEISRASVVVTLDLFWRRHDTDVQNRRFLIVEAATGDTVPNIYRYSVTNERCRIAFGPVKKAGTYYFYYLPYEVQENWGFYGKDYLKPEKAPEGKWVNESQIGNVLNYNSLPSAKLSEFQSRSSFDSFYPMELIPLASEKKALLAKQQSDFLLFPEGREHPIRMKDEIPFKWIKSGPSAIFNGEAMRNEYFAFQIGLFASGKDLKNVKVEFSDLAGTSTEIKAASITCFNTGGIGPYGEPFQKQVDIVEGAVQPLWIGVDIPENTPAGNYKGLVTVKPDNAGAQSVEVNLKVSGQVLADRGDSEPWRHSRLRWLNSTLGIDDMPVKPYEAIEFLGDDTYRLTDKKLRMDSSGWPGSVVVAGHELLSAPVSFVVETAEGIEQLSLPEDVTLLKNKAGIMSGAWKSRSENIELSEIGVIESDGYINYKISIKALGDLVVNDIRLEIPFTAEAASYMMGMGLEGTIVPKAHNSGWVGPHDSFWIGNTLAGLWCELRGGDYHGPLMNLYKPDPPASWYNNNNGGFRIEKDNNTARAVVYSGKRKLEADEVIDFEWSMLITPVKKINYRSQFIDRYYHNGGDPMPSDNDLSCGVRIVNLHHANNYNPHINYPFIAVDSMKWFVNKMHDKGQKVKIYYTIRELTNYATEIWALRSLGDEILGNGNGGGFPWLREHLIDGYMPQWYQHFPDKSADASIVNAPGDSRWYNYYIEGLLWLVRNVGIDGLYLDDVSYDRRTVKRIRKVLDNEKPGCLLDLHSNTGFSKGPATQYAEYFPYVDKLWFGESFQYDKMTPENWLVEVSGIPFGLMGDMLHGGGNRWLGIIYGMTVRHPWTTEGVLCDPRPVWKIWDEFGIESSVMKGYWDNDCPVSTGNNNVKATVYQKEGQSLISVGNWADENVVISLQFDWEALGIDPARAILVAPRIKDFQKENIFKPGQPIPLEPKRGWLLYLRDTDK